MFGPEDAIISMPSKSIEGKSILDGNHIFCECRSVWNKWMKTHFYQCTNSTENRANANSLPAYPLQAMAIVILAVEGELAGSLILC